MEEKVDLLVLGSGPSGQKSAIQGSKCGCKVVVVESWEIGGSALWTSMVPSKALREAICDLTNFRKKSFYANHYALPGGSDISITDLNHRVHWVKTYLKNLLIKQFHKNNIKVVRGDGYFVSPNVVEVKCKNNTLRFVAKKIIIATGSKPFMPEGISFDGKYIVNSTQLLSLTSIPKTMIILGAGIVGIEYASMFCVLDCQVKLIDKRKTIMPYLDSEITSHMISFLKENELLLLPGTSYKKIEVKNKKVFVTLDNGDVEDADILLMAAGRIANVGCLKLENIGLKLNKLGYLSVNEYYQTEIPNIYGVGDVVGGISLASVAEMEGRHAALHACGFANKKFTTIFPYGIYTIPEISYIGKSEEELQQNNIEYKVGRAYFYEVTKSLISGSDVGMCKIIFNPFTLEIYGIHIIGEGATDLIHLGQLAMSFNAQISYFVDAVFNLPTLAEMYRIAALNGLNKIKKG